MTAFAVFEQYRFFASAENPFVSPLTQRGHHRPQSSALVGEHVVVSASGLVVDPAFEHPRADESVEPVRQDVAGDAESLDEVIEAADAEEGITKDQQGPPLADDLERLGDRAMHIGEGGLAHGLSVRELRDKTQHAMLSFVTQLAEEPTVADFDRATTVEARGGLAVEHGRRATSDGTLVAGSFQTRLTAQD